MFFKKRIQTNSQGNNNPAIYPYPQKEKKSNLKAPAGVQGVPSGGQRGKLNHSLRHIRARKYFIKMKYQDILKELSQYL